MLLKKFLIGFSFFSNNLFSRQLFFKSTYTLENLLPKQNFFPSVFGRKLKKSSIIFSKCFLSTQNFIFLNKHIFKIWIFNNINEFQHKLNAINLNKTYFLRSNYLFFQLIKKIIFSHDFNKNISSFDYLLSNHWILVNYYVYLGGPLLFQRTPLILKEANLQKKFFKKDHL